MLFQSISRILDHNLDQQRNSSKTTICHLKYIQCLPKLFDHLSSRCFSIYISQMKKATKLWYSLSCSPSMVTSLYKFSFSSQFLVAHLLFKKAHKSYNFSSSRIIRPEGKEIFFFTKDFFFPTFQYLVGQSLIRITTFNRFAIQFSNFFVTCLPILCQTRSKISFKSFSFFGCSFFIRRSNSSHMCSMELMSGENNDHLRRSTPF